MTFVRKSNQDRHVKTKQSNILIPISLMDASLQENVTRNADERNNENKYWMCHLYLTMETLLT